MMRTHRNKVARHTVTHLFIITLGLFMIYPILWMIVSAFKPNNMIFSDPGIIPKAVTIENYITGWRGYAGTTFSTFFINSLLMCAVAVIGNLISCSMAAYAFSRFEFPGRRWGMLSFFIVLLIPVGGTLASLATKAEVERIWLPFVPWLLLGTALLPEGARRPALAVQVIAAFGIQHLLATPW